MTKPQHYALINHWLHKISDYTAIRFNYDGDRELELIYDLLQFKGILMAPYRLFWSGHITG